MQSRDGHFVLLKQNIAATYFDNTRTIYLYSYRPESRTLYFLKARTDGEVSVPYRWTELALMNAAAPNPFINADQTALRLLGLSRLWSEVKRNFVFMERSGVNWDSLYAATVPAMMKAADRDECFLILSRMAA